MNDAQRFWYLFLIGIMPRDCDVKLCALTHTQVLRIACRLPGLAKPAVSCRNSRLKQDLSSLFGEASHTFVLVKMYRLGERLSLERYQLRDSVLDRHEELQGLLIYRARGFAPWSGLRHRCSTCMSLRRGLYITQIFGSVCCRVSTKHAVAFILSFM